MKIINTKFKNLKIIQQKKHGDRRGYLRETFSKKIIKWDDLIFDYSTFSFESSFDLIKDDPTKYNIGYKYFDECFGVSIDFERSFYEDRDLKPKDILTLMFSFKYLGSYKSTNLAVDNTERQNVVWETGSSESSDFN